AEPFPALPVSRQVLRQMRVGRQRDICLKIPGSHCVAKPPDALGDDGIRHFALGYDPSGPESGYHCTVQSGAAARWTRRLSPNVLSLLFMAPPVSKSRYIVNDIL